MAVEIWSYKRNFSALGKFQQAYSIVYAANELSDDMFSFSVETLINESVSNKCEVGLPISRENASLLLRYLYENGFDTGQIIYIFDDLDLLPQYKPID